MTEHACDVERKRDLLYRALLCEWDDEICTIFKGVTKLIQSRVLKHPELDFVMASFEDDLNLRRACILHALSLEPEFQKYLIAHKDVCANTVSEFIHSVLHKNVELLLNGCMSIDFFVNDSAVAYVTM